MVNKSYTIEIRGEHWPLQRNISRVTLHKLLLRSLLFPHCSVSMLNYFCQSLITQTSIQQFCKIDGCVSHAIQE